MSGVSLNRINKKETFSTTSAGTNAALAAGGLAIASSGANTPTYCPNSDQSFSCKLNRVVGDTKNIIFLFILIIGSLFLLFSLYQYAFASKSRRH